MNKNYTLNFFKIILIQIVILFSSFAFSQTTNKSKILHLELDSTQLTLEVPKGKTWEITKVFTSFIFILDNNFRDRLIMVKSINDTPLTYFYKERFKYYFFSGPILYSSSHMHVLSLPLVFKENTKIELVSVRAYSNENSPGMYSFFNNINPIFVTIIETDNLN